MSAAPVDAGSAAFIAYINNGGPRHLHPDFGGTLADGVTIYGFPYCVVDGHQPKKTVQFAEPDESDGVDHPTDVSYPFYPIPDEAITQPHWVEGGDPGNIDDTGDQDRHLLIVDRDNRYLYELYNVWWDGSQWPAYSGAFFDLKTNDRRPDGWTSADAGGLAILPGLVRYDEVYGPDEIRHAFRFTVRHTNGYVYPASHLAGFQDPRAPPMGARLRLKAGKDISGFAPEIQKIFRAMKTYGLILADNGTDMYVSGTWDERWDNDVLNPAFDALTASDFDVVELGWQPPLAPALAVDARPGASSNQNGVLEPGETVVVEPSWENPPTASAVAHGRRVGLHRARRRDVHDHRRRGGLRSARRRTAGELLRCYRQTATPCRSRTPHRAPRRTGTRSSRRPSTAPRRRPGPCTWARASATCRPRTLLREDRDALPRRRDGGLQRTATTARPLRHARADGRLPPEGQARLGYAPPAGSGALLPTSRPAPSPSIGSKTSPTVGITAGCDPILYCPDRPVTRAQMAVFLLKARHGSAYVPPPATGVFDDVPVSSNFAPWIEQLAAEGITAGCGGGNYCPDGANTRAQMAAFLVGTFTWN